MGKYPNYDMTKDTLEHFNAASFRYIANELGEANRLKRLELKYSDSIGIPSELSDEA